MDADRVERYLFRRYARVWEPACAHRGIGQDPRMQGIKELELIKELRMDSWHE